MSWYYEICIDLATNRSWYSVKYILFICQMVWMGNIYICIDLVRKFYGIQCIVLSLSRCYNVRLKVLHGCYAAWASMAAVGFDVIYMYVSEYALRGQARKTRTPKLTQPTILMGWWPSSCIMNQLRCTSHVWLSYRISNRHSFAVQEQQLKSWQDKIYKFRTQTTA